MENSHVRFDEVETVVENPRRMSLFGKTRIVLAMTLTLVSGLSFAYDWTAGTGTVELPAGETVVTDADLPVVETLSEITVPETATLVFNTTTDIHLTGGIHGAGKLVKRGTSTLFFPEINGSTKKDSTIADHYVDGGFSVECGAIQPPVNATKAHAYPVITLAKGTTLFMQGNGKEIKVGGLEGVGLVTNAATTSSKIVLGFTGTATHSVFSGTFGGKLAINVLGRQDVLSTDNANDGAVTIMRDAYGTGEPDYGTLGLVKFGNNGAAGSLGTGSYDLRFSGYLLYLGSGETTTKEFDFRYLTDGKSDFPTTLDAGATGGVTFDGAWEFAKAANNVGEVRLTGSNAVPCVVNCGIKESGTSGTASYLIKDGTGTWHFKDNASRKNCGTIEVKKGTLRFDSIANKGSACSLGLATCLQSAYQGAYNAKYDVDYAYLLGNSETTNVVFEYAGSGFSSATNRPIALTGKGAHLRNNATGAGRLAISGVSALAEGEAVKTLYLDGTNTTGQVADITDGAGAVGVTKLGSGTWTLAGDQTFTGPLAVKEGTLVIVTNSMRYTWYRFNIRQVGNQVFFGDHLGFFDRDGNRLCTTMEWIDDVVDFGGSESVTAYDGAWKDWHYLKPGQITLGDTYTGGFIFHSSNSGSLPAFFNGTGYLRSAWYNVEPKKGSRSTWIPVVFRVPEGTPEIVSMDIVPRMTTSQRIIACSLDASVDGESWTELFSTNAVPNVAGDEWVSTGEKYVAGAAHQPEAAWHFAATAGQTKTVSQLASVETVSVASGAVLRAESVVTLRKLTVDAAGNGTIDGCDFAEEGTVDLVGLASGHGVIDAAFALTDLPDGALARLNGWTVTRNGKPTQCKVVFNGTTAHIVPAGLQILVR